MVGPPSEQRDCDVLGAEVLGIELLGSEVAGAEVLRAELLGMQLLGAEWPRSGEADDDGWCSPSVMMGVVALQCI